MTARAEQASTRLLWAVHSHQPVGNFDFVFENAFRNAYEPFVSVLERHPTIGVDFHFSGILLDWLDTHQPDLLERIAILVKRGQCGLLGGAYNEPILPPIPRHDQVGQIVALADRIQERFGVRPRGMWLAERVWEPGLPAAIAEAGMEFTLLDGTHFAQVGFGEEAMFGRWLTESEGKSISVFPIHDRIRDLIPFSSVEETLKALRGLAIPGGRDVAFGDDGEKFGDWPGTHELCYTNGWLERFFTAVEQDPSLSIRPVSEAFEGSKPQGMAYLPAASYFEMMEWAETAARQSALRKVRDRLKRDGSWDEARPFVRGVSWRNFLVRYPESNRMHKLASRLSFAIRDELAAKPDPARRRRLLSARDHVWQAQCNCGYWHGVFGGLYLPHLRRAIHGHLARAEKLLRGNGTSVERADWDLDGTDEILLASGDQFLSIHPGQGGAIPVWSLSRAAINLADSMTRRPEAYHARITGEEGRTDGGKLADQFEGNDPELAAALSYDEVPRVSGLSWWFPDGISSDSWVSDRSPATWLGGSWTVVQAKVLRGNPTANLSIVSGDLQVERRTVVKDDGLVEVTVTLTNLGAHRLRGRFGNESMFNFLAGDAHDRWIQPEGQELSRLGTTGSATGAKVSLGDGWLQVGVKLEAPAGELHWQGIHTVNQSVGGYEKVYQGTSVLQLVGVDLAPSAKQSLVFRTQIGQDIVSPL